MEELQRSLGRIEGKLDGFLADIGDINKRIDAVGKRIDSVEQNQEEMIAQRNKLLGAFAVIVFLFGLFKASILRFIEQI